MARASHAEHFLKRVDRLSTEQAELALGLYRDPELLKLLLAESDLPAGVGRVALSLGDDQRGPFIIVTRGGKLVTCLGKGMRIPDSQPVVSRRALDRLSEKVEALRELCARAASGRQHHCDRLLYRVCTAGPDLCQEEFDDLVTWAPCVSGAYINSLVSSLDVASRAYRRLRRVKRIGARHEPLLKVYWDAAWAAAHLTLLVGAEPRTLEHALDLMDQGREPSHERRAYFVEAQVEAAVTPLAMRGVWLAAKLPKLFLPALKQLYIDAPAPVALMASGLGLVATGIRHRRYRAEVHKALNRARSSDERLTELAQTMGGIFAKCFEHGLSEEGRYGFARDVESMMKLWATDLGQTGQARAIQELSSEVKRAAILNLSLPLWDTKEDLGRSLAWLPEVACANPRDFYIPREHQRLFAAGFQREEAVRLLESRFTLDGRARPEPTVVDKGPGRNAPCPCGSGNKYKRCCAS